MMRHLVTGGAGFLGSHLCERLIVDGHEVIALDNFFTGHRRNVRHLVDHPRFELVRGDVCDPFHFEVDRVWHLACPASPVHYQRNPARTIETAVLGTRNALECARVARARILIASTSEVYGDPLVHPQPESYWGNANPHGERSCYDEGKRCGEAMAFGWRRQYDTQVRIARIFNTYGPRMAVGDGRVVSNFIVQALRGEPLTVFGEGTQTRSFCYVSDLIDGFDRLMRGEISAPVNLGNPTEYTIAQLARAVAHEMGVELEYKACALPADDPRQRRPDITRAREELEWVPAVPLHDGIKRTVAYFREALDVD
jgi:UDP-glucuronate decarboxylase